MNCFYHPTTVAVGTCKSCGKGLCPECAVDLGKGLACKGRCEEDAQAVINLIDRNITQAPVYDQIVRTAQRNRYFTSMFLLMFGLTFLAISAYNYLTSGYTDIFLWAMGGLFLIFGVLSLLRAAKIPRLAK